MHLGNMSLSLLNSLRKEPIPELSVSDSCSIDEAVSISYRNYMLAHTENNRINQELAATLRTRNELADQYNHLKKMKSYEEGVRRRRRYAKEIQRNYYCPVTKCNKGYGSQGSLTHHVRLKHIEYFESGEYEEYISRITDQMIEKQKEDAGRKEGMKRQVFHGDNVMENELNELSAGVAVNVGDAMSVGKAGSVGNAVNMGVNAVNMGVNAVNSRNAVNMGVNAVNMGVNAVNSRNAVNMGVNAVNAVKREARSK